jgi:hypothetical protein
MQKRGCRLIGGWVAVFGFDLPKWLKTYAI